MKLIYEFTIYLRNMAIVLAVGFFLMAFSSYQERLEETVQIEKSLTTAEKGFLRIKTRMGGGQRVRTINAYGYIEGIDSSNVDSRRVIMGIGEVYSKEFEKDEGELIPIWYEVKNNFVYARVYKTPKETVDELIDGTNQSKSLYIKVTFILMLIPIFFYLLQRFLSRFVKE